MEAFAALFALGLLGILIGGSVCGLFSTFRLRGLARDLRRVEVQLRQVERHLRQPKAEKAPAAEKGVPPPEKAGPEPPDRPETAKEGPAAVQEPQFVTPPGKEPARGAPPPMSPPPLPPVTAPVGGRSLEIALGTKWITWVGMLMFLMGIAFGLKYVYDNDWIGAKGRLAIGAILGIGALGMGERFRRKDWPILFQAFTGGGIAIFYICVFFSFQVYHLSDPGFSFLLAILVTAFAVVMAVAHNAVAIAVLALVGGFLSPVLLSTGENHPYVLFSYIAVLDLVALGAAYYRRWRALDLLCLVGTALLYQGWYLKFYDAPHEPSQLVPALLYTSLFYLLFLLIPVLHSLVRRLRGTVEGLVLLAANAVLSFYCYYNVLFEPYRQVLGFVVLGQALLVFLLFRVWLVRMGKDARTAECLLIITLALATLAVPI